MGKEIEIKLAAPDAAALEAVGADARVEAARTGAWQEIRMVTEYLDTPDRAIAAREWTLRRTNGKRRGRLYHKNTGRRLCARRMGVAQGEPA